MRGKASSENESTSAAVAEGKESSDFCRNPPLLRCISHPKKFLFLRAVGSPFLLDLQLD